jgi:hypothetical protein
MELARGGCVVFPFRVDPDWYDKYWLTDRPQPTRRPRTGKLRGVAAVLALLAAGGAVLSEFRPF